MRITWYGHAAFSVEGQNRAGRGIKIILDPYNYPECGGYLPIDEAADIVSVSHDNPRYHSDTSSIRGEFDLSEALAFAGNRRTLRGVEFESIEVYEDAETSGPNAMVKFELDGITVAHQGDLGHALDGDALEFLRGVDVLLALAGGSPTIGLDDLRNAIAATKPPIVIPMHYRTPKVNLDLLPVEAFLEACVGLEIVRANSTSLEVSRATLPESTRVVVLDHAR